MKNIVRAFIVCTFFSVFACSEEAVQTPKPRAFPRVLLPARSYEKLTLGYCDFSFDYPSYAKVVQDTLFFDEKPKHPCWFDLDMPALNGKVHCTYYPITSKKRFEELVNDAFDLSNKHNIRADYIDEYPVQKPNGVSGFVFNIDGPAATPFQFYLTDSTRHFVRGALYFRTQARPDSLAPVVEFVKYDIMNIINTFEWKK